MGNLVNYKKISMLLAACMLTGAILSGCSSDKESAGKDASPKKEEQSKKDDTSKETKETEIKGTALKNDNESLQLTIPDGWVQDKELNPLAVLSASKRSDEKYIMVIPYNKKDFSENSKLDDFANTIKQNIGATAKNLVVGTASDTKVGDLPAKQVDISGEVNGVKAKYLMTYLEKGDHFYQIAAWTTESKFDQYKDEFKQVSESFRVLKDDVPMMHTKSNNSDKPFTSVPLVLKSDNGKSSIAVDGDWKKETGLIPDASIQATNIGKEEYMGVISEPKSSLGGATLTDYYKAIKDNMEKNTVKNAKTTKPVNLKINNKKAIQFELSGEVDNVKITYLMTLVESSKDFHQVIFWTLQQRMDSKRELFKKYTKTFKVK